MFPYRCLILFTFPGIIPRASRFLLKLALGSAAAIRAASSTGQYIFLQILLPKRIFPLGLYQGPYDHQSDSKTYSDEKRLKHNCFFIVHPDLQSP
jgi:hypothetical protein